MGKKQRLPKRIAGLKVPKRLRKSRLLGSLLASRIGRQIVADALVAGAGAAATVLLAKRENAAGAAKAGARKGAATLATVTEAVESAAGAMMDVVTEAARGMVPEQKAARHKGRKAADAATRH